MASRNTRYEPAASIGFRKEIRFNPDLSAGEKVFLAEVESMTAKGRFPFKSQAALADIFGVSNPTITSWITRLVKKGFLEVEMDFANEDCKKFLVMK